MKLFLLSSLIYTFLQNSICISNQDDTVGAFAREESKLISTASLQVAALGRIAALGDLYDAKTDNFVDISIYTTEVPSDAVRMIDNENSAIHYVRTEAISEKIKKLGVSASLSASFLGGLVSASGSGKYLNQAKKTSKSAKASLVYSLRTARQNLNIFSRTSRELIDRYLLDNVDATHVVVGIEWGADVVLSLEETNTDSSNVQEIQRKLEEALKLIALSISSKDYIDFEGLEESKTFNLYLNGDVVPSKVPQTIEESVAFITNIEEFVQKENDGKGKIMRYILMPLTTVQKVLQTKLQFRPNVAIINQDLTDQFLRIFQEMTDSKLQINDIYDGMSKWSLMIPKADFQNVSNVKIRFDSYRNDFRVKFGDLMVQFRSGELDDEPLKDLITQYEASNWTAENVRRLLGYYTSTMHKIRLMELFESFNASFIYRETDKYHILANNYQHELRILSVDLRIDISSPYVRNIITLLEANTISETKKYYIEDDPDSVVPKVIVYLEGNEVDSFSIGKKECVLLISRDGDVIIIDGNSYNQIIAYRAILTKRYFLCRKAMFARKIN